MSRIWNQMWTAHASLVGLLAVGAAGFTGCASVDDSSEISSGSSPACAAPTASGIPATVAPSDELDVQSIGWVVCDDTGGMLSTPKLAEQVPVIWEQDGVRTTLAEWSVPANGTIAGTITIPADAVPGAARTVFDAAGDLSVRNIVTVAQ